MSDRVHSARILGILASIVVGVASLVGMGSSPAMAQTAAPVISIRSPSYTAGNITVTGIAVDCRSGSPATRVAVYDGSTYLADVSMDTTRDIGSVCAGRS